MPGLREIVDEPSWTQKHASSRGDDEASARREELARATAGSLMRTIEVEVIPRLLLVHGVMATGPRCPWTNGCGRPVWPIPGPIWTGWPSASHPKPPGLILSCPRSNWGCCIALLNR